MGKVTAQATVAMVIVIHKDIASMPIKPSGIHSFISPTLEWQSDSFEGEIFGRDYCVTGFYKVQRILEKQGHQVVAYKKVMRQEIEV